MIGDLLVVDISYSIEITGAEPGPALVMGIGIDYASGLIVQGASAQYWNAGVQPFVTGVRMQAVSITSGSNQTFDISLCVAAVGLSATLNVDCNAPLLLTVHHYRPN